MHNSGEKECAAIALDGLLSEEAGYSDGSIKKPISMKKESSRNGRHGEWQKFNTTHCTQV